MVKTADLVADLRTCCMANVRPAVMGKVTPIAWIALWRTPPTGWRSWWPRCARYAEEIAVLREEVIV